MEVCAKILYQVELSRNTLEQMWGFSVEAELVENADRQDELCCYVSRVEDKSVAMQNGTIFCFIILHYRISHAIISSKLPWQKYIASSKTKTNSNSLMIFKRIYFETGQNCCHAKEISV